MGTTSTGAGRLEAGLLGCWFPPAAVGIVRCWCQMAQFTRPCEKRVPGGRDRNRDGKSDIGLPSRASIPNLHGGRCFATSSLFPLPLLKLLRPRNIRGCCFLIRTDDRPTSSSSFLAFVGRCSRPTGKSAFHNPHRFRVRVRVHQPGHPLQGLRAIIMPCQGRGGNRREVK